MMEIHTRDSNQSRVLVLLPGESAAKRCLFLFCLCSTLIVRNDYQYCHQVLKEVVYNIEKYISQARVFFLKQSTVRDKTQVLTAGHEIYTRKVGAVM